MIKRRLQGYFQKLQTEIKKQNEEIIWGNVWHDTARGVSWLNNSDISFSPGRWAVGYNYLYVMTRILNDFRPNSVLEFGLGISTTLISRYFSERGNEADKHIVVEHDTKWIEFYTKSHELSSITRISQQELLADKTNNGVHYYYKDISELVSNQRFQVISVDAPFGGDIDSRSDILEYIPEVLADEFIIVFDDANRDGERMTIEKIKNRLDKNNIGYSTGIYTGITDVAVICSEKEHFYCSL